MDSQKLGLVDPKYDAPLRWQWAFGIWYAILSLQCLVSIAWGFLAMRIEYNIDSTDFDTQIRIKPKKKPKNCKKLLTVKAKRIEEEESDHPSVGS